MIAPTAIVPSRGWRRCSSTRRIAAPAREAGADPATLPSPTENEDYLRRRFMEAVAKLPDAAVPQSYAQAG